MPKPSGFFEENISPHLRAAYNFARWLVRNDHDAEDIVQESFMKAFAAVDEFRGNDTPGLAVHYRAKHHHQSYSAAAFGASGPMAGGNAGAGRHRGRSRVGHDSAVRGGRESAPRLQRCRTITGKR